MKLDLTYMNEARREVKTGTCSLGDLRELKRNVCGYKGVYKATREYLTELAKSSETEAAREEAKGDLVKLKEAQANFRAVVNDEIARKTNEKFLNAAYAAQERLNKVNARLEKLAEERENLIAFLASSAGTESAEDSDEVERVDELPTDDVLDPDAGFDFSEDEN